MAGSRVLILSQSFPHLKELFPPFLYDTVVLAKTAVEGRQLLREKTFDLVLIQSPLCDEHGVSLAKELSGVFNKYIMLLVPPSGLDQASWQTKDLPVFVLPSSTPLSSLVQAIDFLEKAALRQMKLEEALLKEKKRFAQEKTVSYCKIKLMETCAWSEQKAHDFILKTAMDHSLTKGAAAKSILRRIEMMSSED